MPTTTRPVSSPVSSPAAVRTPSTAARASRARVTTAAPADVVRAPCRPRSNSRQAELPPSRRTAALTAGWATRSRAAAPVKLPSSATATT